MERVDWTPSGGLGVSSGVDEALVSSRAISPAAFSDSCSWYHMQHFSLTFSSPSKTHTASGVHSTPSVVEMNVRRTDPKIVGETPKAPIYFDKSCSCGGVEEGYDRDKDTRTENLTWSRGSGNLLVAKQELASQKPEKDQIDTPYRHDISHRLILFPCGLWRRFPGTQSIIAIYRL